MTAAKNTNKNNAFIFKSFKIDIKTIILLSVSIYIILTGTIAILFPKPMQVNIYIHSNITGCNPREERQAG